MAAAAQPGYDLLAVVLAERWTLVVGLSSRGERFVTDAQGVGPGEVLSRAYVRARSGAAAVESLKRSTHLARRVSAHGALPLYQTRVVERPAIRAVPNSRAGGFDLLQLAEPVAA